MELRASEVCEIIRAAKECGVVALEFAGLSLKFEKTVDDISETGPAESPRAADQPTQRVQTRTATPTDVDLQKARQELARLKALEEEAKVEEQVEAREVQLQELMTTDPEAYEDAIINNTVGV